MALSRRDIIVLSWPIVLANAGIPLLGLADTAVIGNVGTVTDLGAVGLGALIFSFVFWGFGFLRMGTTGFVAQASGKGDSAEVRATVARNLILAVSLGLTIIVLQRVILWASLHLLAATPEVEALTARYFNIRIWAAPAALARFTVIGALIGLGRTRAVLSIQVALNSLNIALDILFAGVLGWGVAGIAAGTMIAEWAAVGLAIWLLIRELRATRTDAEPWWPSERLQDGAPARAMLAANRDIMLRTLFLLLGFGWFTSQSAALGDAVLAANHVLLQLITLSAYLLDGYAHSVEILVGRAVGAGNMKAFDRAVQLSTELSAVTAAALAAGALLLGRWAIAALTDLEPVRQLAFTYLGHTVAYIGLSFVAFQLDGILIGATATREMRNSMGLAFVAFFLVSLPLIHLVGAAGLWIAFILFVVFRALAMAVQYEAVRASVYNRASPAVKAGP